MITLLLEQLQAVKGCNGMETWRIMIDFGLVVLVWMTQTIVYPSFSQIPEQVLLKWHRNYTLMIALIVIPLMFAQLGIVSWQAYQDSHISNILSLCMVVVVWIHTFLRAAPLHGKISQGREISAAALSLVKVNWFRTILWTVIWLFGMITYGPFS